jgi:hypothetical protein
MSPVFGMSIELYVVMTIREFLANRGTVVGRGIIDYDCPSAHPLLRYHALYAGIQESPIVVAGNYNVDGRLGL